MGSKRNSATVPNIEFTRTVNPSKEDKCREFWKYLDEKNTLEPYQPPKCKYIRPNNSDEISIIISILPIVNEAEKPCEPCTTNNSKAKSTVKESKVTASKGAKPKQTKQAPPKKGTKTQNSCAGNSYYEKLMR